MQNKGHAIQHTRQNPEVSYGCGYLYQLASLVALRSEPGVVEAYLPVPARLSTAGTRIGQRITLYSISSFHSFMLHMGGSTLFIRSSNHVLPYSHH
jgi:hypothetical protein